MKRTDFILITAALIVVAVILLRGHRNSDEHDLYVVINVENKHVCTLPLDKNSIKEIKTDSGYNIVVIEDGYVFINEADCKNQVCVKTNKINKVEQSIVCLPHKLSVRIISKDNKEG